MIIATYWDREGFKSYRTKGKHNIKLWSAIAKPMKISSVKFDERCEL